VIGRPSAAHVRHHCWLTQEPLKAYLKETEGGDDSGDEANEATELLEMNEIEFETEPKKGLPPSPPGT
jgi:hypothetical protein